MSHFVKMSEKWWRDTESYSPEVAVWIKSVSDDFTVVSKYLISTALFPSYLYKVHLTEAHMNETFSKINLVLINLVMSR